MSLLERGKSEVYDEERMREKLAELFAPLLADLRGAARVTKEGLRKRLRELELALAESRREVDLRLAVRELDQVERSLRERLGHPEAADSVRRLRERYERELDRLLDRRLERIAPYHPDREHFSRRRGR